jgi:membrane protein
MNASWVVRVFGAAIKGWGQHNGTRIAASLAFFAIFSIAPLMVLVVAAVGIFFGMSHVKKEIQGEVSLVIGQHGSGIISSLMKAYSTNAADRFTLVVTGILIVVYAAGLFLQVQNALDDIWEVPPHLKGGFTKAVLFRAHTLLALGALAVVAVAAFGSIDAIQSLARQSGVAHPPQLLEVGSVAVNVLALAAFLTIVYRVLPQIHVRWGSAVIGGIITTITLVLGEAALSFYFRHVKPGMHFGALESFVVVLLWIHYSAVLLIFGAELTRAFENQLPR